MRLVRLGEGLLLQAACGASPGEVAVEQPEAVQDPVVIKASIETCCPKTSLSASQMLLFEALYSLSTSIAEVRALAVCTRRRMA